PAATVPAAVDSSATAIHAPPWAPRRASTRMVTPGRGRCASMLPRSALRKARIDPDGRFAGVPLGGHGHDRGGPAASGSPPAGGPLHQGRVVRLARPAPVVLSRTSATDDTRPSINAYWRVSTASDPAAATPSSTGTRVSTRNRSGASAPNAASTSRFPPTWATATPGSPASWPARSRRGTGPTPPAPARRARIIHNQRAAPKTTPTPAAL